MGRSLLEGVAGIEDRHSKLPTEVLVPLYYLVSRSIVLIEFVRPNFASLIFRVFVVATARMHRWHMLRFPFSHPVCVFPNYSRNLRDKYTVDDSRICCIFDNSQRSILEAWNRTEVNGALTQLDYDRRAKRERPSRWMFKEMIITFATMDTSYELAARWRKMFRQRCQPLRREILARSMNNVGFLQRNEVTVPW